MGFDSLSSAYTMFTFPDLPYSSNSLEPYIDQKTMEIHHGKHHKAYFDNFLKAIQGTPLEKESLESIFANISKAPAAVRNNGGGFYNHNFFWNCLHAQGQKIPAGRLGQEINASFGSYEALQKNLIDSGLARFGSGFVWLILNSTGKLEVMSTPNQNNPLMQDESKTGKPLMAIDVWEHAYYLNYQNRRADYLAAFFNVVDWSQAISIFEKA